MPKLSYASSLVKKLKKERFYIKELKTPDRSLSLRNLLAQAAYQKDEFEDCSSHFAAYLDSEAIASFRLLSPRLKPDLCLPIERLIELEDRLSSMEISQVVVAPAYRARAYCSALISCCFAYAEKQDIRTAYLLNIDHSHTLLDKIGFRSVDEPNLKVSQSHIRLRKISFEAAKPLVAEVTHALLESCIIQL